jgi:hypothetical protein
VGGTIRVRFQDHLAHASGKIFLKYNLIRPIFENGASRRLSFPRQINEEGIT